MKLEIREIKDRGTIEERIVLIVNEDCNLGYFLFSIQGEYQRQDINFDKTSLLDT